MDDAHFDTVTRSLTRHVSRRQSAGGLLGGVLAVLVPDVMPAAAKHGKHGGKKKKKKKTHGGAGPTAPPPDTNGTQAVCQHNSECPSGTFCGALPGDPQYPDGCVPC